MLENFPALKKVVSYVDEILQSVFIKLPQTCSVSSTYCKNHIGCFEHVQDLSVCIKEVVSNMFEISLFKDRLF